MNPVVTCVCVRIIMCIVCVSGEGCGCVGGGREGVGTCMCGA